MIGGICNNRTDKNACWLKFIIQVNVISCYCNIITICISPKRIYINTLILTYYLHQRINICGFLELIGILEQVLIISFIIKISWALRQHTNIGQITIYMYGLVSDRNSIKHIVSCFICSGGIFIIFIKYFYITLIIKNISFIWECSNIGMTSIV